MSEIRINIPNAQIYGRLQSRYVDIADMDHDILEVFLPVSGLTIDVGWHPEFDPAGCFRIVLYRDFWQDQVRLPIYTRDPFEVAQIVRALAEEYSKGGSPINIACSGTTTGQQVQMISIAPNPYELVG
jgi:hypothetical protein